MHDKGFIKQCTERRGFEGQTKEGKLQHPFAGYSMNCKRFIPSESMTIKRGLQYLGIVPADMMPADMMPLDEKSQKLNDKSFVLARLVAS